MGSYKGVSGISQKTQWAHTSVLAVFFSIREGPTQVYWKYFSASGMGPCRLTQVYWQYFSASGKGLCKGICSIFQHQGWAHTSVSAVYFSTKNGPTQGYQQ